MPSQEVKYMLLLIDVFIIGRLAAVSQQGDKYEKSNKKKSLLPFKGQKKELSWSL